VASKKVWVWVRVTHDTSSFSRFNFYVCVCVCLVFHVCLCISPCLCPLMYLYLSLAPRECLSRQHFTVHVCIFVKMGNLTSTHYLLNSIYLQALQADASFEHNRHHTSHASGPFTPLGPHWDYAEAKTWDKINVSKKNSWKCVVVCCSWMQWNAVECSGMHVRVGSEHTNLILPWPYMCTYIHLFIHIYISFHMYLEYSYFSITHTYLYIHVSICINVCIYLCIWISFSLSLFLSFSLSF